MNGRRQRALLALGSTSLPILIQVVSRYTGKLIEAKLDDPGRNPG